MKLSHAFVALSVSVILMCGIASGQLQINGAGATFPYPLISKWSSVYHKLHPGIQVNYQSIGSGGGIRQLIEKTVDFGASDAPMNDEQMKELRQRRTPVVHIPWAMGAVVVTYNLLGINNAVRFDGATLADIYLGRITKWNDVRLRTLNPDINLPDAPIIVVHRSDGSGTTYIFADYLAKVSSNWKAKVGVSTSLNWPVGIGGKGNEGVAGQVKRTPNSIGYVELIYALQSNMPVAKIKNADGVFVKPSIESVTEAAAGAAKLMPEDLRVSITNAPGKNAYPISSFTYALIYQNQAHAQRAKAVVEFVYWAITEGQRYCSGLDYAPIPKAVQELAIKRLKLVNVNGESLLK